jgi:hypothetical protein
MTMLSVMVQKGLAILVTSLSRDSSPQVRRFCTLALGSFARGYSLDVVKEGGVQVLVERLSIDSSTAVRSLSAEILAHLLSTTGRPHRRLSLVVALPAFSMLASLRTPPVRSSSPASAWSSSSPASARVTSVPSLCVSVAPLPS